MLWYNNEPMTEVSYEQFANTPMPWLPDQPFWQANAGAISAVRDQIVQDYPHTAEILDFDPAAAELPSDEQRREMWATFMGKQHGGQQDEGGKKVLIPYGAQPYMDLLRPIQWGPYPLTERTPIDTEHDYNRVLTSAGSAIGHAVIAEEMAPNGQLLENLGGAVWLSGQRPRGSFHNVPGENVSPKELIDLIGGLTGTDMDELVERFPRLQDQLRKTGEGWYAPFGNESDIVELNMLAHFGHVIGKGAEVELTPVYGANEPVVYRSPEGKELVMPRREYGMLTYTLNDGRKMSIVNGPAVSRGNGDPRATSTSIAEDAPHYVPFAEGDHDVMLGCAPHIRAVGDTAISFLNTARHGEMPLHGRIDAAATAWPVALTKFATAALGEVMATMKADARARAVLTGKNPNSPQLMNI
jgi:hypothetical protein